MNNSPGTDLETMRKKKNVSLLKSGIKRIGSFCSRSTRSSTTDCNGAAAEFPSMLKDDDQETEICLFDDDDDVDDDDSSCMWLSSSASPSSFFDEEGSSCCSSSFVVDEEMIRSSSREVVFDLASWVSELEKDGDFLADLDLEYCWIPSSFPSPSFVTCCSSNREAEEAAELEHLDDDDDDEQEALFWPFEEGKLSWNPDETWISFAMSPRKDNIDYSTMSSKLTAATTPSKCPESEQKTHDHHHRHHNKKTTRIVPKSRRVSSLVPQTRRMSSNSDPKPAVAARRRTAAAAADKHILPSRLLKASESSCKSAKASMKVVPLEIMMMGKNRMGHGANGETSCLFGSFGRDHEVPIEKLMGLQEFDGHEGMDSSQLDDDLINGGGGHDDNLFSLVD